MQDLGPSAQEGGGPTRGVEIKAEGADAPEEAVPLQHCGIDGREGEMVREELLGQQDVDGGIPPARMVRDNDERALVHGRLPPTREPQRVHVPAEEALEVEARHRPGGGRAPGERRKLGCALHEACRSGLTRASASSASAAIQPDIITMGMPGPGCAAPPAR
jgi:hypothetical protein